MPEVAVPVGAATAMAGVTAVREKETGTPPDPIGIEVIARLLLAIGGGLLIWAACTSGFG